MEDDVEVEGYKACRCGTFMPDTELRPAKALCPTCRGEVAGRIRQARVALEVEGHRVLTPDLGVRKRKVVRYKHRPPTMEEKEFRRRSDRARMRAFIRLSNIYSPMFEMLWEVEKLKEGIPPVVDRKRPKLADTAALLQDIADAEERMGRQPAEE